MTRNGWHFVARSVNGDSEFLHDFNSARVSLQAIG